MMRKIFLLGVLFCLARCKDTEPNYLNILTNHKKGKFWDLVYQTDIYGTQHSSWSGRDSMPKTTLFFDRNGVIQYFNFGKSKRIDVNKLSGDTKVSYNYTLKGDTLNINSTNYLIKTITNDSLMLVGALHPNMVKLYVRSETQDLTDN